MDANTLFWFFSTVAQTLVALVALAGVVAVYRIEQLSRAASRLLQINQAFIGSRLGEVASRPEREVVSRLEEWLTPYKTSNRGDLMHATMIVNSCKAYDERFRMIRKRLIWLIGTTSATVFLSLCFLMIVSIIQNRFSGTFLMALIIFGSAVSMFQTVFLFTEFMGRTLLSDPDES